MAFDLSTAKPVESAGKSGFDLSTAKPVAPSDNQDTSSIEAFRKIGMPPTPDKGADFPGQFQVGNLEALASAGTGLLAAPIGAAAGVGKTLTGGKFGTQEGIREGEETAAKVQRALTYEPRTQTGRSHMERLGKLFDASKLAGLGPSEAMAVAGMPKSALNIPGVNLTREPVVAPRRETGSAGASRAVNELQRQHEVIKTGVTPGEVALSPYEEAVLSRERGTKPLREAAFTSKETVASDPIIKLIGELESKNPDKTVRSALAEVRATMARAMESTQKSSLPPAGTRVTADQLKALQGVSGRMSIPMADEVRQSINRMIEAKGDKALDRHTQSVLKQVRDRLTESAPEGYRKYLSEYAKLSEPLEKFRAPGSARESVATDPSAFHLLNDADKQRILGAAFEKGNTPGRTLSELVRDTAHSPEAAQGVRQAYTDWLTQADPLTQQPTARGLASRWQDTRDAVKSSKLMTDDHIASMDKIMDDVRKASEGNLVKKAWASTAGFILGQPVGHPIVGAHAARDLLVGNKSKQTQAALEKAMLKISADPAGAAALAAPPTPQNVSRIQAMLPTDLAALIVPVQAQEQQKRKATRLLSLQPAGF